MIAKNYKLSLFCFFQKHVLFDSSLINIQFFQKLIKQINKMRQQSQSQHQSLSGYTIESFQTRKQRIDKKRAIRKNKVGINNEDSIETKEDKKFLSKQQKMQIQKAKNRQAAQKSRDQHKVYVQTLQEQNRKLREQLGKPKYCTKCSKQISYESEDSTDPSQQIYSPVRHLETFIENQNNQESEQFESPFIRMNDYEDSSPLKMFLLISMIMVGVFLIGGSTNGSTNQQVILKRDLMEIPIQNNGQIKQSTLMQSPTKRFKQIQQITKFQLHNQMLNSFNMEDSLVFENKILTKDISLSYQLSPLSQQGCLKSIIENNYTELSKVTYTHPTKAPHKNSGSLRANNLNQMEVFTRSAQDSKNNVLFCSLPKLYRKSEQIGSNLFSNFIDIVISGSEMMEIMGNAPNLWMNKMINFNGIYKINAQVKEIIQIEDSNCIL